MASGDSVLTSSFKFDAIGTSWEINTAAPLAAVTRAQILDLVERFDSLYSRFRHDSIVTRIAKAADGGTFGFPADAAPMFDLYDRLHDATDGAVDPLVGRDLELLGYDGDYALVPDHEGIAATVAHRPVWSRDVQREGRLVDLISDLLTAEGFKDFVVDGSGDICHRGDTALDIGLEHPLDPDMVIGVVNLKNGSICASASNRRTWGEGLHHVLDGRTGRPTTEVIATWAVASDTATADGLATALFFGASSRLMAVFDFSYLRMFADGRVEVSDNFDGEVFT